MKKSLFVLLAITTVFLGVITGIYIGRNSLGTTITINPNAGNSASDDPAKQPAEVGKVNINTADAEKLKSLPGIGASKASRIIEYRNTYGKYTCIEDLIYVDGFSYTIIENLRPYITVGG